MDSEIVKKAKTGDPKALEEIYNETRQMVYFTALGIVKNEYDAEDMVQDTYIKVFENLYRLQDETAFPKWLKTIVINISKNHLKKRKPSLFQDDREEDTVVGSIEEVGENFLPQEYLEQEEKLKTIKNMIFDLPDTQRIAVTLYYYNELPLSEVSKIMETSDGTTKSRLNYARKQIKAKVDEQEKKGNKLYVGVPTLTQILHLVSRKCDLPAQAAKDILANSLKAANVSAGTTAAVDSGAASQSIAADSASAAAEDSAAETTAGTTAGKGILAKIAGMSVKTRVIALLSVGILLAGGGTGIAVGIKRQNDAAQAAIVLQQKQKAEKEAKAASEAAAKKAKEEAAEQKAKQDAASSQAKEKSDQQTNAFLKKLCYEWNSDANGMHIQYYTYFYTNSKCRFVLHETVADGDKPMSEGKTTVTEYNGTFKVIGENEISMDLTYSEDGVADPSKNCSATVMVDWNWDDEMKEGVLAECPNAVPMSLKLKSGTMPFSDNKCDETYSYYRPETINSSSSSSNTPSADTQIASSTTKSIASPYAADYLGMTLAQFENKFGKDYYSPACYEGGMVVAYHDNRVPFQVIFNGADPTPEQKSTLKLVSVVVEKGQHVDKQLTGEMTYQQLKTALGSSIGSPEELKMDGSWHLTVTKSSYQVDYSWKDQALTQPISTYVSPLS